MLAFVDLYRVDYRKCTLRHNRRPGSFPRGYCVSVGSQIDLLHPNELSSVSFIFLYSPAYNIGYNALTYTFLVELFPFHIRAKGIAIFQFFGRAAGFFNQFVNPIGIANAGESSCHNRPIVYIR